MVWNSVEIEAFAMSSSAKKGKAAVYEFDSQTKGNALCLLIGDFCPLCNVQSSFPWVTKEYSHRHDDIIACVTIAYVWYAFMSIITISQDRPNVP